jgi:flagellar biosynthesis/type III secretory pathway protein FliH
MSPLRLEVFETTAEPARTTVVTDLSAMEEARLAAYEQGYTAGWDDASAAQSEDQTRLGAEIARNLQTLAFTYHEARTHVLRGIEPLLAQMTERVLPDMARAALAPMIVETLRPMAADLADAPVILLINPAARPAVEALLERSGNLPVAIQDEPTLGEGQAQLRFGPSETRIDLDRAVADIATAVRGFFDLNLTETSHG